jgi:hypothetical protein
MVMKIRYGVNFLFVVLLVALGTMNLYGQSSKLIGMWQSGLTYVLITEDTIIVYPNDKFDHYDPRRGFIATYSWKDTDNDGLTISVNDKFTPYFVSNNNLVIQLPSNSYGGRREAEILCLAKCIVMPDSKLSGKWTSPAEPVDIEVTINDDQILFKKGRSTQSYYYQVNEFPHSQSSNFSYMKNVNTLPGLLSLSTISKNDDYYLGTIDYISYFFMDDTHILICMYPFSDKAQEWYDPERTPPLLFLTRQ